MAGHALDFLGQVEELLIFCLLIHFGQFGDGFKGLADAHPKGNQFGHLVGFGIGHAQDAADVSHRRLGFHPAKGDDVGHSFLPIFFNDVVNHFVSSVVGKIEVHVGC